MGPGTPRHPVETHPREPDQGATMRDSLMPGMAVRQGHLFRGSTRPSPSVCGAGQCCAPGCAPIPNIGPTKPPVLRGSNFLPLSLPSYTAKDFIFLQRQLVTFCVRHGSKGCIIRNGSRDSILDRALPESLTHSTCALRWCHSHQSPIPTRGRTSHGRHLPARCSGGARDMGQGLGHLLSCSCPGPTSLQTDTLRKAHLGTPHTTIPG